MKCLTLDRAVTDFTEQILTKMELETLKYRLVPVQKLGTMTAEKVCLSHFHHCWGKKKKKEKSKSFIFPLQRHLPTGDSATLRAADVEQDSEKK